MLFEATGDLGADELSLFCEEFTSFCASSVTTPSTIIPGILRENCTKIFQLKPPISPGNKPLLLSAKHKRIERKKSRRNMAGQIGGKETNPRMDLQSTACPIKKWRGKGRDHGWNNAYLQARSEPEMPAALAREEEACGSMAPAFPLDATRSPLLSSSSSSRFAAARREREGGGEGRRTKRN
uniref:Uncharacterized protein n=1 Tax=Oryza rufipogon TaxID=4529 RepID=A0A0E0NJW4_ORYRU